MADCLANVLGLSWHNMAPTQPIKSDPCICKSDSFEKWNSIILQKVHRKQGFDQQGPRINALGKEIAQITPFNVFFICKKSFLATWNLDQAINFVSLWHLI